MESKYPGYVPPERRRSLLEIMETDPEVNSFLERAAANYAKYAAEHDREEPQRNTFVKVLPNRPERVMPNLEWDTPAASAISAVETRRDYDQRYGEGEYVKSLLDDWCDDPVGEESPRDEPYSQMSNFDFNIRINSLDLETLILDVQKKEVHFRIYETMPGDLMIYPASIRDYQRALTYMLTTDKTNRTIILCLEDELKPVLAEIERKYQKKPVQIAPGQFAHPVRKIILTTYEKGKDIRHDSLLIADKIERDSIAQKAKDLLNGLARGVKCMFFRAASDTGTSLQTMLQLERYVDPSSPFPQEVVVDAKANVYSRSMIDIGSCLPDHDAYVLDPASYFEGVDPEFAKNAYQLIVYMPKLDLPCKIKIGNTEKFPYTPVDVDTRILDPNKNPLLFDDQAAYVTNQTQVIPVAVTEDFAILSFAVDGQKNGIYPFDHRYPPTEIDFDPEFADVYSGNYLVSRDTQADSNWKSLKVYFRIPHASKQMSNEKSRQQALLFSRFSGVPFARSYDYRTMYTFDSACLVYNSWEPLRMFDNRDNNPIQVPSYKKISNYGTVEIPVDEYIKFLFKDRVDTLGARSIRTKYPPGSWLVINIYNKAIQHTALDNGKRDYTWRMALDHPLTLDEFNEFHLDTLRPVIRGRVNVYKPDVSAKHISSLVNDDVIRTYPHPLLFDFFGDDVPPDIQNRIILAVLMLRARAVADSWKKSVDRRDMGVKPLQYVPDLGRPRISLGVSSKPQIAIGAAISRSHLFDNDDETFWWDDDKKQQVRVHSKQDVRSSPWIKEMLFG